MQFAVHDCIRAIAWYCLQKIMCINIDTRRYIVVLCWCKCFFNLGSALAYENKVKKDYVSYLRGFVFFSRGRKNNNFSARYRRGNYKYIVGCYCLRSCVELKRWWLSGLSDVKITYRLSNRIMIQWNCAELVSGFLGGLGDASTSETYQSARNRQVMNPQLDYDALLSCLQLLCTLMLQNLFCIHRMWGRAQLLKLGFAHNSWSRLW